MPHQLKTLPHNANLPLLLDTGTQMRPKIANTHNALMDAARTANGVFDRFFYNVTPEDEARAVQLTGTQGSIIFVSPDPKEALREFPDAVEFLSDAAQKEVGAISVAGVGSSAIGAVGFARDVAAATGEAVAAVVSGYGVEDAVYQGLGGWMCLREDNQFEFFFDKTCDALAGAGAIPGVMPFIETWDSIGCGPDIVTLKSLLRGGRMGGLKWLAGHSKGNLVIASAISELVLENVPLALDDVNIVLLSAVTALPKGVGHLRQFLGRIDLLGGINSCLNVDFGWVDGAHWLNRSIPLHLNAIQAIRSVTRK